MATNQIKTAVWNMVLEEYSRNITVLNGGFSLENLAFWLPWPPIKIRDLDKIHMIGRGLLQKHFSKTFVKISAETQK